MIEKVVPFLENLAALVTLLVTAKDRHLAASFLVLKYHLSEVSGRRDRHLKFDLGKIYRMAGNNGVFNLGVKIILQLDAH